VNSDKLPICEGCERRFDCMAFDVIRDADLHVTCKEHPNCDGCEFHPCTLCRRAYEAGKNAQNGGE
jgi:hypothetical protein